jgi:RHS repeat-associated protein
MSIAAKYAYSPFGALIAASGPAKDLFPLRFQSKYYDHESGFYYYGYRYYDPTTGKWLTPDPLEEQGGINLTAFCGGDPVNSIDSLGLAGGVPSETPEGLYYDILAKNQKGLFISNDAFWGRPNLDDGLTQETFLPLLSVSNWKLSILHQAYTYGRQKDLPDVNYRVRWANLDTGTSGAYRMDVASLAVTKLVAFGQENELQMFVAAALDYEGHVIGEEAQNVIHSVIHSDYINIPYIDDMAFGPSLAVGSRYRLTGYEKGFGARSYVSAKGEFSSITPSRLSLLVSVELETAKWRWVSLSSGGEVGFSGNLGLDRDMEPMYLQGFSPIMNVRNQLRIGNFAVNACYMYQKEGWNRSVGEIGFSYSTEF